MLQCLLILASECLVFLVISELSEVDHGFPVDPRTTEEAWPFALLLTYNLAAVDAVVDKTVFRRLTVAYDTLFGVLDLGEISILHFLDVLLNSALCFLSHIICLGLDLSGLFFVLTLIFESLYEISDEGLDLFFRDVDQI